LAAPHGWLARVEKRIPVAAGLGGGSSDAATALRLANAQLAQPRSAAELHELAAGLGADVPFFLHDGPRLGTGDGTALAPLELPQDFWVLLLLPDGAVKPSTAEVYASVARPRDLARLPANDLASSPLAGRLVEHGAFRADVSGAGPALYGLFTRRADAARAARALRGLGRTWIAAPAWYG